MQIKKDNITNEHTLNMNTLKNSLNQSIKQVNAEIEQQRTSLKNELTFRKNELNEIINTDDQILKKRLIDQQINILCNSSIGKCVVNSYCEKEEKGILSMLPHLKFE